MFTPGCKLKYSKHFFEELATQIKNSDKEQWIIDKCNEVGEKGLLVINFVESCRESAIKIVTDQGAGYVPYYGVTLWVVEAASNPEGPQLC